MFKIEPFNGYFLLNGIPYQRGKYRYTVTGGPSAFSEKINIYEIGTGGKLALIGEIGVTFDKFRDASDQPFASMQDLINYLDTSIFL